jgi:hypothetical protein
MAITPKDALLEAKDALDLTWTAEQQDDRVATVVDKLVNELSSAEGLLRTAQVLWLPDQAKDRASAKRVLALLTEASGMLAQGDSALGWAKVAGWAALRVGIEKDRSVAAVVSLLRSAGEWTDLPSRYADLVGALIRLADDATSLGQAAPAPQFTGSTKWPPQASTDEALATSESENAVEEWTADPAKLRTAVLTLQLRGETLLKGVKTIEEHLIRPPAATVSVSEPIELLWWGQSLYSRHLRKSYRELEPCQRLFWMAEDMAELGSCWPSEQRIAYFAETLGRAGVDLDTSRTLREHARDVAAASTLGDASYAPPAALAAAVEADPTGLPTTFLSAGAKKGIAFDNLLDDLAKRLDMDPDRKVPSRRWAIWVCRERHLFRFLHDMVG